MKIGICRETKFLFLFIILKSLFFKVLSLKSANTQIHGLYTLPVWMSTVSVAQIKDPDALLIQGSGQGHLPGQQYSYGKKDPGNYKLSFVLHKADNSDHSWVNSWSLSGDTKTNFKRLMKHNCKSVVSGLWKKVALFGTLCKGQNYCWGLFSFPVFTSMLKIKILRKCVISSLMFCKDNFIFLNCFLQQKCCWKISAVPQKNLLSISIRRVEEKYATRKNQSPLLLTGTYIVIFNNFLT